MLRITIIFFLLVMVNCTSDLEVDKTPQEEISNDILQFDEPSADRPIDIEPDKWELDERLSDQFGSNQVNNSIWDKNPNDWGPWSWEPDNAYTEDEIS